MKSHALSKKAFFDTQNGILALLECEFLKIDKSYFLLTRIDLYVSCGPNNYINRFLGPYRVFFICITCLENPQKVFYWQKMKLHALSKKPFFDTPNWILTLLECDFEKSTKLILSSRESTCKCRVVPKII